MIRLISRWRFFVLFLLLVAFVLIKAVDVHYELREFTGLILLVLMLICILIIGKQHQKIRYWLLLPLLIEISLFGLEFWVGDNFMMVAKFAVATVFMLLMTLACLVYTLADRHISITTLFGSLSAYLFIGLAYSYFYLFYMALLPSAFEGMVPGNECSAIYYSFVTMTTLGYGDIIPIEPIAQTITWLEAYTGQGYLAIIMAQLVGRYVAEHMGTD